MLPKAKGDSFNLVDEESEQSQDETESGSPNKPSTIIDNISSKPKLLAWSSYWNNKISVVELETKQKFANFDGVKLTLFPGFESRTHLKEITNTGLLVSVHHRFSKCANLEVFDVSRKGQTKKIYSATEVVGVTGYGDVTYNPRRNFLGAICVAGKIAYHLYNFGTSKSHGIVKLIRKSRWYSQYSTKAGNLITSLDFSPNGETEATIDRYGVCLISDVNTDSYHFHLNMKVEPFYGDCTGRCRWSSNPDEPLLFVKYDKRLLNILDVEKKAFILKEPIQIEHEAENYTMWIDVCQSDGNILVSGGTERQVKIFDKRKSKIAQTFDNIHTGEIRCVRWSPSGDMIASASFDKTAALLDFKTGKKLYTGNTSDGSKFHCLINNSNGYSAFCLDDAMSVCFI